MLEALITFFTEPYLMGLLLLAVPIGLVFGIVPGLGGKLAIIVSLPFLFNFDPLGGAVFLISLHAVVHTGGALPAILFGIPGTGPSTAIVADGHALAKNGEASRALTASIIASGIGGVLGAILLAMIIPFTISILKMFSYSEIFMLTIFGILFCAVLSEDALIKGLITGCLGLLLAMVGIDELFGVDRFTYSQTVLWDGLDIVAAILSLYAIPEMIAIASKNKTKAFGGLSVKETKDQHRVALKDIIQHKWLVFRTSLIGTLIGIIPGLGGDVAAWFSYGHAAQTSKEPHKFGKGAIEGVIGPEAANNSKEGGSLVPTLFLGIPGSSGMAIFLIALVPLGISPGPELVLVEANLIWIMVIALVVSNIVGAYFLYLISFKLAFIAKFNTLYLVPYIYIFAMMSIYLSTTEHPYFLIMAGLAFLGYLFKKQGWPRAPFVVGFILGPIAEKSLIQAYGIWGPSFILRPMTLFLIIFLSLALYKISRNMLSHKNRQKVGQDA